MTERLVVIGGDAAGMSAASQARRRRGPDDLAIVAFERGNFTSFSACGIPYFVGETVSELDQLIARTPEEFEAMDIEVHLRHEVTAIDTDAQRLTVKGPDGERNEPYDQLMVATGAVPKRPDIPGADADGIFGVQTLDHGLDIKAAIEATAPKHAVVIGGGYIGLEMAEAMVNRGIRVTLIDRNPQPMTTLDPDMGALVADAMRGMGIDVRTNQTVTGFEVAHGSVTAVVTADGEVPTDIVILGLGVRPNVELAQEAGLRLGGSGAVAVDRQMRASVTGVWSAGDCAEKYHRITRTGVAFALGTHANKEGRVAGINLGGGYATFPGVVGTAVSKICDYEVARTGLKESEATAAGFDFITSIVESTTRAGYFPGATKMKVKLLVEQRSGLLLGAQIIGREGAAKRIDVLATALWNEMTVDDLHQVDLSYAPPFSPVWDPVLIAARKAWEKVEDSLPSRR